MTDYDKLKQLFDEFGVEYDVIKDAKRLTADETAYEPCKTIRTNEGGKKVTGYFDFFTLFDFDLDGKFIEMGAWE